MKTIDIDIETYSSTDLLKCGVYKYAEANDFEIILFGYSVDGGEVCVVDLANGEKIPEDILSALSDNSVTKWAHNASFERICLSRFLGMPTGEYLEPTGWKCSMVWSAYLGLPLSLKGVGAVLGLDKQKLNEGKDLIRYFCVPCNPTKVNGGRTRNMPFDEPNKWATFISYNQRDVEVEMQIQQKLSKFSVPDFVWKEYHISEEINDRGICVDMNLVTQAISFDERIRTILNAKMCDITHLDNPNSVTQMKKWLAENGLEIDSLGKKEVAEAIKTAPQNLAEVLVLRQQLSKSSVKKYTAMKNAVCSDGRCRGMFMFYGANRTGRFAGRLVQLQNLPQNHIPELADTRELVASGNYNAIEMLYDDIPDTLSQLIRTAFVPRKNCKFIVSDFSAIEARVIAWLAGEEWKSKAFADGQDIYCSTASKMFGVNVVKHGENGELRQKGKITELACGYGGAVGALKAMGALEMGLSEDELQLLVTSWRNANPNIVKLWWDVDKAVKKCVKNKTSAHTHGIDFVYQSGFLFITLPSGRQLAYVKPRMSENKFGGESVTYEGVGGMKKRERIESYGPKFVENIVQAISRDILMYAIKTLCCCSIVAHVHDELIIECDRKVSLEAICEQMGRTPPWADGLQLRADGYECEFYMKD